MEKSKAFQTNKSKENSVPPKSALQQMLKGLILSRNTTEEKDLQNHTQTRKWQ